MKTLLDKFKEYITIEHLWQPGSKWLVAVSGGLDSVVLTDLCAAAGIDFVMAHCNFQLRGSESERDEQFVRDLAKKYGRYLYVERFDTDAYCSSRGVSVQEGARDLRYAWFRTLLGPTGSGSTGPNPAGPGSPLPGAAADAVATAHHRDDNVETLLMNFFKGTGISGLRGMLPLQDRLVRPLLFSPKTELRAYAEEKGLTHVEDSSNETDKYTRNFFRLRVIPLVEERYPSVMDNLGDNLARFSEVAIVYRHAMEEQRKQLMEPKGEGCWHISLVRLRKTVPLHTILYEMLLPFGFTPSQSVEVAALLNSTPGHYVASATHRILRDRKVFIITPLQETEAAPVVLEAGSPSLVFPGGVLIQKRMDITATGILKESPVRIALLDAAKISHPLLLRRWKPGDYFYPLGMRKKKKLSRFFIDAKLSLADKEKVWVLESDGRILWVLGQRIDDRFRVTPATTGVLHLEWVSH